METFELRQGELVAQLYALGYEPAEGFIEANTWHAVEERIVADCDVEFADGPATLRCGKAEYDVIVSVLHSGEEDDDEEKDEDVPAYTVEIGYAEGVRKLAELLGLVE